MASNSNCPALYGSKIDLLPTKWCFTAANCVAVGAAVPMGNSRNIWRESHDTMLHPKNCAIFRLMSVLPTPVGPTTTNNVPRSFATRYV